MPPRALIIGGGPAGTTAGLLLARHQWQVTLIEQHRFPRDKVCGECVSAIGTEVLQRAGVLKELLRAGAVLLHRTQLHDAGGQVIVMRLPRPCLGISRRQMDATLLAAARQSGVTIHQPARCEGLIPGSPGAQVRDLLTNHSHPHHADIVLLADGKGAFASPRPARTGDLGVKAHFTHIDAPRSAVELFTLDGHYVGLNPVEAGRWNLAMSVPADRVRALRGDFDRLLGRMLRQNPGLAKRLAGARRISDWLASPLPRFAPICRNFPQGVIPIGNAAAALEPIGGEGMGLAMRSAEIAVDALLKADISRTRIDYGAIAGAYIHLWRTRRVACRLAAMAMSNPTIADPALGLLAGNEPLQQAALRLIGK